MSAGPLELHAALRFFKALADESRLRMVAILAAQEASVDELAVRLDLRAPTVSHHLARLKEAGLVTMRAEGTTHLYRLNAEALRAMNREVLSADRVRSLVDDQGGAAWERRVLHDFFEGQRLKEIPAMRKKRDVILRWLATQFEPGRRYTEREVNEVIQRHHVDAATLRRELIGAHLMARQQGVYWRTSDSESQGGTPSA